MKEAYSDCMMLCFVQSLSDKEVDQNGLKKTLKRKTSFKKLLEHVSRDNGIFLNAGRSEKFSSKSAKTRILNSLPEVKSALSERVAMIIDPAGRRTRPSFIGLRKTRSTGNFNCSVVNAPSGLNGTTHGSGGNQVPRSEPSTPLQIDPASLIGQKVNNNNSSSKLDRNAVKQLSGSAASVAGGGAAESGDSETKAPSKARQKKFLRHFPQVGPDERVLNYYSCALVGDILLQGHLYITKNYFAFYSNVFGYVTKLLIPTASVVRVEKERLARIIPNAVGVSTSAERHVFGSLLSRDATYRLMTHVVKVRKRDAPELEPVTPPEIVPEASEYSDSSCSEVPPDVEEMKDSLSVTSSNTNNGPGPVIQPALLLGATVAGVADYDSSRGKGAAFAKIIAILLALSATALALMLFAQTRYVDMPIQRSVGEQYAAISYARRSAHANAARDLQRGLHAHLQLMHEVRKSLETLTSLIASDLADASSQDQNGKIVFGANSIESDELR